MANNKENDQKKKQPLRRQPRINQRIIWLIVAIAVIVWVILAQVRSHNGKNEAGAEKNIIGEMQSSYQFHDQGELSFQLPDGKTISQIEIELADNPSKITLGLMYREKMAENQGMLFIFPDSQPRAFWMKNTILPLDMIFADPDGIIVTIQEHTIPLSEESYISEIPAKYVVEVNAGYVNAHDIKQGDKIVWTLKSENMPQKNEPLDSAPAQ
jgi:uncharacterized membrane protein (UPF0127 family)